MNVLNFEVSLGGDIKPYNETISQARARIFYKGLNRNGGYITDDFAQQLAATLPKKEFCRTEKRKSEKAEP